MNLVQKLRYMGAQYAAGQAARGGGVQKHYLEEAADELTELRAALAHAADLLDAASACSSLGPDETLRWWDCKGKLVQRYKLSNEGSSL